MSDFPEFDDLPDDPEIAFVRLCERYEDQLTVLLEQHGGNQPHYLKYINSVLAAATALDIQAFNGWRTPDWDNVHDEFATFSLAVQNFTLQVKIRKTRSGRIYSVELDAATKKKIHFLVSQIRELVQAADLKEDKRNSLFKKLNAFDADVDKARTSFNNAMLMGMDIAAVAQRFSDTLKPAADLFNSITELMGAAKEKEPEINQLPAPSEQKRVGTAAQTHRGPEAKTGYG